MSTPRTAQMKGGAEFDKWDAVLDQGHQQGLDLMESTLLQAPHPDNGMSAIVLARVHTERGTFSALGEGNPRNLSEGTKDLSMWTVQMAETRAYSRALRNATNIEAERLAPPKTHPTQPTHAAPPAPTAARPAAPATQPADATTARPAAAAAPGGPSDNQLATITKLARLLGRPAPVPATRDQASEAITELSREYNARNKESRSA